MCHGTLIFKCCSSNSEEPVEKGSTVCRYCHVLWLFLVALNNKMELPERGAGLLQRVKDLNLTRPGSSLEDIKGKTVIPFTDNIVSLYILWTFGLSMVSQMECSNPPCKPVRSPLTWPWTMPSTLPLDLLKWSKRLWVLEYYVFFEFFKLMDHNWH